MNFAGYELNGRLRWGVVRDGRITLAPLGGDWPASLDQVVALGLDQALKLAERLDQAPDAETLDMDPAALRRPLARPPNNVMCLGLNYAAHARESFKASGKEVELPEHPVVFTKAISSINDPNGDVVLDPEATEKLDWEVELGVVIGQRAHKVSEADALNHVFGYMVVNDLSARDLQFRHKQFFLGKSVTGCCPMGPWIVSRDAVADPQALAIRCRVNDAIKQDSNTGDQIFGVAQTIAILSRSMVLEPGDVIATGTPEGVGFARTPPEFLHHGDVVECEIDGIGVIRNRIVPPA